MRKGLLILISGPSGTGKGTVCDLLRQKHPEISYSISATTRQPRPGEQDGVNYYFYTKEKFREMIDRDSCWNGQRFMAIFMVLPSRRCWID